MDDSGYWSWSLVSVLCLTPYPTRWVVFVAWSWVKLMQEAVRRVRGFENRDLGRKNRTGPLTRTLSSY